MKKLLLVLAIGAFVASCNDTTTETESTSDTSAVNAPDTTTLAPAPTDTTTVITGDSSVIRTDSAK